MLAFLISSIVLIAYISLGYFLARQLLKVRLFEPELLFIVSMAMSGALYLALFGVYLFSSFFGELLNLGVVAIGLGTSLLLINYRAKLDRLNLAHFLIPLCLCLAVSGMYSVVFSTCRLSSTAPAGDNRGMCHIASLPMDNALPYLYAENIRINNDTALIGDWKLTDRPPLQIGMALSNFGFGQTSREVYKMYYLSSLILQGIWVGAIYSLLLVLKVRKRDIIIVIALIAFSSFTYINSVFVWPKLLSSSFMIGGILLLISRGQFALRMLPVSTFLISLSLLTHSGAVFTLIGFLPILGYLFVRSYRNSFGRTETKYVLLSILISTSLILPWQIYKGSQERADRLVKWHFAGIIDATDNKGTFQAIRFAYSELSLSTVIDNKVTNLKALFSPISISTDNNRGSVATLSEWHRANSFFVALFAVGLLNAGWFTLIRPSLRNKFIRIEKYVVLSCLFSLFIWSMMMFLPGSTVIHQGSYATILLLMAVGGVLLSRIDKKFVYCALTLQVISFLMTWVVYDYILSYRSLPNVLLVSIFTLLLIAVGVYAIKHRTTELPK